MRFVITMNMPARAGNSIHQVICDHPAKNVYDFCELMNSAEFIVVEEFYRDNESHQYYSVGFLCLNTHHVGKVKEANDSVHAGRVKLPSPNR